MLKKNLLFLLLILSSQLYAETIINYKQFSAICNLKNIELISLRQYQIGDRKYYFLVNPDNLETSIHKEEELQINPSSFEIIRDKFKNTVYFKAIRSAEFNSQKLQDAGIAYLNTSRHGINLTLDLCPSKHNLDSTLFNTLIDESNNQGKPIPIAIAISGLWIENHETDLNWLLALIKKRLLSITWINHSYNHWYDKTLPLDNNFLLNNNVDINIEVLQTEIKLLEHGIIPSVFFRFPGLVSDSRLFHKITDFGLIPIGSNAWLAKDEIVCDGSIVLVHANGNEPLGVSKFFELLSSEKDKILKKQWSFFSLQESIIESMENK